MTLSHLSVAMTSIGMTQITGDLCRHYVVMVAIIRVQTAHPLRPGGSTCWMCC